jgi:hypothetical protein
MSNAWPRRSSSICAPCSTNTVYARPSFVTMCGTPGHERGPRPNFRRNSDTYRRLRETHGEIALADEDRARRARSPSRPRPRAFALTASTTTRWCSRCSRSIVGLASNTIAAIRCASWAVYVRCGSTTRRGNPDSLWRPFRCHDWRDRHLLAAQGPGTGARTPLIYLLMAVSARRLSTATVGEVNVHWRSVAKWM